MKNQHGQALVEFALVLLFIILPFTAVLVESALLLFSFVNITNAAREGARAGSIWQCVPSVCPVDYTDSVTGQVSTIDDSRLNDPVNGIKAQTKASIKSLVAAEGCAITPAYDPDPPIRVLPNNTVIWNVYRQFDSLSVTVACRHRLLFGLVGDSYITVTAESSMKIEPGGIAP